MSLNKPWHKDKDTPFSIIWSINAILVITIGYKLYNSSSTTSEEPPKTVLSAGANINDYETFAALPQCAEQKRYTNARFVTVGKNSQTQVLLFSCGEYK